VDNLQKERLEMLKKSVENRRMEVMNYQINIDNFTLAIAKIESEHSDKQYMLDFSAHLSDLLQSSIVEQAKEKLMMEVIEQQLQDEDGCL
jgi:hypothetical protein